MKNILLVILSFLAVSQVRATHLFGGDLTYTYIGDNQYQVKLVVYRDCGPSNSNNTYFDATANIAVYNVGAGLQTTISIPLNSANVSYVEITFNDPCLSVPSELCVQQAIYTSTVTLPFSAAGYTLSYQRCCRNNSIDNISNPANSGMTLTTQIPGTNSVAVPNSSPTFNSLPPVALCLGSNFVYDIDATDIDGDSLVYSFCNPLLGGTATSPTPNPPTAPPYTPVSWSGTYSTGYPIASNPAMTVNAQTGQITGVASQLGTYAVALCVAEYRNGILINTVRRDYQFNVVLCDPTTTAAIGLPTNTSTCVGSTIGFTNNSLNANAYLWDFGVDSLSTDTSTLFQPTFVYNEPGTYTITLITNPGLDCADTTTMQFTAHEIPIVNATSNSPICAGQDLLLYASSNPGVAYQWTGPLGFTSNIANTIRHFTTPSHTGNYSVTASFPGCVGPPATVAVVVYATPNANPTTSGSACVNGNIQLIGNGGLNYTYAWTGPNNFNSTEQSPWLNNVNESFEGYYYLQLSFNGCNSVVDSTWVNVLAEPSTNASYNSPLCWGDSLHLTCAEIAGATYQWTGPNGFSSNLAHPDLPSSGISVEGNYSVVVVSASCPSLAATVNVDVIIPPVASILNVDTNFCEGEQLILQSNILSNANYYWTGPNGFSSQALNPQILNLTVSQTGQYSVQIEQNGCFSNTDSQSIHVFSIPTAVINTNAPICENELLSVSSTVTVGSDVQYSWIAPNGQAISNSPNFTIEPAGLNWNGQLGLVISSNGCSSPEIDVDIVVHPTPLVTFAGDNVYCQGDNLLLSATAQVLCFYSWTGPLGFTATGSEISMNNVQPSMSGNYNVIAVANNSNGCQSEPTTFGVTVNANPIVSISTPDSSICLGDPITLVMSGANTGFWTDGLQGQSITITPNNDVMVTVTGVDNNGCINTDNIQVIVHQPWVSIDGASPILEQNSAWVGGYYPLNSYFLVSGNADNYVWEFGDTSSITTSVLPDTMFHIYENPSLFLLTITAEIDGCFAWDTIHVETYAESLLGCSEDISGCALGMIPNLVTADGDGLNDTFWIPNRYMREWEVKIFDRWGDLKATIDEGNFYRMVPKKVWDPADYSPGVYFYTYKGEGVDYLKYEGSGYFQVVK